MDGFGSEAMKDQYIKEYVKGRPCYSIPKGETFSYAVA
jgi:hypothetical protein